MSFEFEKEGLKLAIQSIRERKLRSILTTTGIIIGIAAIISLVSIGEGTNKYINEQFEQFGANKIIVTPSTMASGPRRPVTSETLSSSDLNVVKRVRGVDEVIEILSKTLSVEYKKESTQLQTMGIHGKEAERFFSDMQSLELENGRFFGSGDRYVVVMGYLAAKKSFSEEIRIRDRIVIKDKEFTVIGTLKEIGSTQDDMQIMVPLDSMRTITGSDDEISFIFASAYDRNEVEDVADRIQQKFDNEYGEDTFLVMSTTKLAGQVSSITNTLSAILGGVSGIALIVAGIGISNTMYMSTLERTKEIGIMKSIGATRRNIMEIFLIEAALLGLIGGVLGIIVGTGLSKLLGLILKSYGMPLKTHVSLSLMLLGVGFAVVVGVISGFLPAKQASELDPIEALRYE